MRNTVPPELTECLANPFSCEIVAAANFSTTNTLAYYTLPSRKVAENLCAALEEDGYVTTIMKLIRDYPGYMISETGLMIREKKEGDFPTDESMWYVLAETQEQEETEES